MRNINVLIVDDSRSMRQILSGCVTQMGYQNIKTLSNGNKAVIYFQTQTADLIFLDLEMPGLSGLETLAKIKELCSSTYVVIISSASTADNVKQAFALGAQGFIVKPFTLNMIEGSLNKFKTFFAESSLNSG